MNHLELSKRLATVGDYVPKEARLADIGSDHAYLPVALMLKGQIAYAVAGEVVIGPFQSAEKQVAKNGLQDKIVVRLADGLDAVQTEDNIDTVTICGMGGGLIRDILESGKQNERIALKETLILQPNVGESLVRRWLMENNYEIAAETILEEKNKTYEIIVGKPAATAVSYSEVELYFGPFLMKEKNDVFLQKWQRELKQKHRVLEQLKGAQNTQTEKMQSIQQEITWIEEVI